MSNTKDKNVRLVWEVAKWEFKRVFKLKEQVITLLIAALLSLLIFGGKSFWDKTSEHEVKIGLVNNANVQLDFSSKNNIVFHKVEAAAIDSQKKLVAENIIDGLLIINDAESAVLFVNNEPIWLGLIQESLNAVRRQNKLGQLNISDELLSDIFKQSEISVHYTGIKKEKSSTGEKFAAGIFNTLMLFGIFLGLAYQFVAITGEKQLRITEVVVSAITPQTWIDGKIIGISLLSLALLVTYSLSSLVFIFVSSLFGSGWAFPLVIADPVLIIILFLFSFAGFLFWNTLFSAIAATINDPNTSARGSLMMVPVIPLSIAFYAIGNPDSLAMRILSVFPFTSAPVISVRLVLSQVPIWEILLSLALLILSTLYLRKAAGRIFALSILMYGKEPSWKEILKWFRMSA